MRLLRFLRDATYQALMAGDWELHTGHGLRKGTTATRRFLSLGIHYLRDSSIYTRAGTFCD